MAEHKLPEKCAQMVIVLTPDWDKTYGTLFLLEKKDKWIEISSWRVCVGKKGIAWGIGLNFPYPENEPSIYKKEGDLKSPAGLFRIQCILYGYVRPVGVLHLPYVPVDEDWIGVDDSKSSYYNRILRKQDAFVMDWNSCEQMLRKDKLYQWVIAIEHNWDKPVAGAGSCIFFHLWQEESSGTAGCTAMSESNMLRLAQWLCPESEPVLLQIPVQYYAWYRKIYELPDLSR